MNSIYDYDYKKVFDTTRLDLKTPFYMKLILPFLKTYKSEDFINDNGKSELWSRCEYKRFKDKIYITKFKNYYIQRFSHLTKGDNNATIEDLQKKDT